MTGLFDEARYKALLKRLDITVLTLSAVRNESDKLRFDSGYVSKKVLRADKIVRRYRNGTIDLGSLCSLFVKGIFDLSAESYVDEGVPFLRILNLRDTLVDDSNLVFIPEEIHEKENKTALHRGDFVLSKTAYPAASVVTFPRCNTSQDTIAARLKPKAKFNVETVVSFLNSRYGTILTGRQFQGNVQMHLSLDDGRKIPVPCFGSELQKAIANAVARSAKAFESGKAAMNNAEGYMLEVLGFGGWTPPKYNAYVRASSDVFMAGRVDAEYFSPAKYAALDVLRLGSGQPLRFHYDSIRQMFDPSRESGKLVRNFDVTDALKPMLGDTKEASPAEEIGSVKKIMQSGDVAISRLRSYLREIALVRTVSPVPMVGSSEFIVLRQTKDCAIPPETLLVFLRSLPVQTILKYSQDGSNHPRFGEQELLSIPVPDVLSSSNMEIVRLVNRSIVQQAKGSTLLAVAKRAVEIAIEDSEEKAIRLLTNETQS